MAFVDAVELSRLQFFFTISFHIIFPSFTIGLSAFIATLHLLSLKTGREHYLRIARFWTKIFAVSFAMGVVSGIVLSYQFGTNWSRFSVVVGNVNRAADGLRGAHGILPRGLVPRHPAVRRQSRARGLHAFSAVIVAVGTCISAFWILSANSWMHTPTGHEMRDGIAFPVDWSQIIFNPSFPYRFTHMLCAAFLTTAVVVMAAGARYLHERRHEAEGRTLLHMGLGAVAILAPLQLLIGDQHGLNTLEHQPVKVAAMEGHWDGSHPGALLLFAWPDMQAEKNHAEIAIPNAASLILMHDSQGLFKGLKDFPRDERPNVARVFFAFRIMVGVGLGLIALGLTGAVLWMRKRLLTARWYLAIASQCWPLGFIAILAGWIVTESGRQPWVAYGILRTADAASPVSAASVATSLALFVLVYGVVFSIGIYYVRKLIRKGPQAETTAPTRGLPNRPLSSAQPAARDDHKGKR